MYVGDFKANSIVAIPFNSINPVTKAAAAFDSTPTLAVIKVGANEINNLSSAVGIDAVTGLLRNSTSVVINENTESYTGFNTAYIDTSDAFFSTGEDYAVIVDAGLIGGVTADGMLVGTFSLENRYNHNYATVETDFNVIQSLRLILAALTGRVAGAEGNSITFKDINNTVTRITATVDANGNRTAVTVNGGD